ncbi:MAG: acyltransferase domain-containing protein [Polyangiaceae bacterium]|nr:acyltransferase domain-containing protein [Polyangiaceae bacterium]
MTAPRGGVQANTGGPLAFVCPGQGSKRVDGVLRSLVRAGLGVDRLEKTAALCGTSISTLMSRPSTLDKTDVLQPVLTAISLVIADFLKAKGITPTLAFGHSAGEIAAWSIAGGISGDDAVQLSWERGKLMAREALKRPGGMVAVKTGDASTIEECLAHGRKFGMLVLSAENASDEVVLSGELSAVQAVCTHFAVFATRVPTSGAWHSPLMEGALAEWERVLNAVSPKPVECTLIANCTGEVVLDCHLWVRFLKEQLVSKVEWVRTMEAAAERVQGVITLGPSAVLRALWHRHFADRDVRVYATEDERSLSETARVVGDCSREMEGFV